MIIICDTVIFLTSFKESELARSCQTIALYAAACIPRGSVIGPLLFNLFINDLSDNLNSSVTTKLFADDVTMYSNISHVNSCSDFQSSLNMVKQWSFGWQLQISVIKSNIIVIGSGIDVDFFLDDT